jgi:glycosyltransferase involved in cell wall biosynthesis
MKINVLIVTDHGGYHGKIAGIGRNLSYILPHIDTERFYIVLAILREDGSLKSRLSGTGIEIIHLNRKKFDPRTLLDLVKIIRGKKINLLHLYQYGSSNFGRIAGILTNTTVILHSGDLNYEYPWYQMISDRILRKATDYVLANSEAVKKSCVKIRGIDSSKIVVIPNAISPDQLEYLDDEGSRDFKRNLGLSKASGIVGTVTRLHAVKGNDILLQAAEIVLNILPNTYFIIVGDGPLRKELTDMAQKLGIDGNVIFAGYQENVGAYLSIFDVMAIASNTEGFPLALLEAMTKGNAIVATRVGGMKELLSHGISGRLVAPRDPKALADEIINLLQHPEDRKKLGSRAREASQRYSIDRHLRMRQKIYVDAYILKRNKAFFLNNR